jgi:hypothetical protein
LYENRKCSEGGGCLGFNPRRGSAARMKSTEIDALIAKYEKWMKPVGVEKLEAATYVRAEDFVCVLKELKKVIEKLIEATAHSYVADGVSWDKDPEFFVMALTESEKKEFRDRARVQIEKELNE